MKKLKLVSVFLSAVVSATFLFGGCAGESTAVIPDAEIKNFIMPEVGEEIAVVTVKDFGEIKIKLFPEESPKGVENFIGLAEMGYYDELIFHRVIPGFMNQGGDPKGNGTGGNSMWGGSFDGGVSKNLFHFSGAVAYANSGSTATNGSQFYIVNTDEGDATFSAPESKDGSVTNYTPSGSAFTIPANAVEKYKEVGGPAFLDGGYTVFGQVFEGYDVVQAIAKVETSVGDEYGRGADKPMEQVMIESVKIVKYE